MPGCKSSGCPVAVCAAVGTTWRASKLGGIASGCVKKTGNRHAVREMEVDPPEPSCRGRFQTAISCYGPMAAVVNVMVKRRDFDPVMYGLERRVQTNL